MNKKTKSPRGQTKKANENKKPFSIWRLAPLLILVLGFGAFFYFDGHSYISLDTLKEHRGTLKEWVSQLGILAPLIYGALYTLVVAFSIPLGAVMSITAGFLFGIVVGVIMVVIGATIGATLLFLAVQMGFGGALLTNNESMVAKMREGFNRNAFSYLLALRLVPIFPFALVNIVAALIGVPLGTYFFGTLFGIIPGSLVYIMLGNGLGAIFDAGGTPNLGLIFEPQIIAPIAGLAGLILLQVAYTRIKERKRKREQYKGKVGTTKGINPDKKGNKSKTA